MSDTTWRRPLASRNQFPLSLLFVSLAPNKAGALPNGRIAVDVSFDYSNIISGQDSEDEILFLDLEYLRTTPVLALGLPHQIEIGASIPFYVYYGGFLDPFIDRFHEAFNLPNFLRGMTEYGQTRYELVGGGATPFLGEEPISDVGDLTLHFKKTLVAQNAYALAFRTDLKLPTGSVEKLSGSGATDVGIGVAFDRITDRWALYVNANYHFLGQPEALTAKDYFSFMGGFDLRLKPRLTVHAQYEHAEPSLQGMLPIFDNSARQLAVGLRWRYSDRFMYEWRFVEDLSDISPDFTVAFQLGIRWNRNSESKTP